MAGRGVVEAQDKKTHPRVFALSKEGEWELAVDPIHFDKSVAGVGLGKSFALALVEDNAEVVIGLIPVAWGGSPIASWQPGGFHEQTKSHPYDNALLRARLAMKDGVLKGILWHQGESDSKPELAGVYKDQLRAVIERFRRKFKAPELPFIIGQLGQFPQNPWNEWKRQVDTAHQALAKELPFACFVPSDGLAPNPDNIHFNSKSLREFGRRYADVYLTIAE